MKLQLLFYIFTQLLVCTLCAKINTPRILLPWFEDGPVSFVFEITDGGCYSWSVSNEDVIDLEVLGGDCSRAARVTPRTTRPPPASVTILAEDTAIGEVLRGDVDVDKISRMGISSTTQELFLEEAPEAFQVDAYDAQGDKFTSLEGVEFIWTITDRTDHSKSDESVVRLTWWSESAYEAPSSVALLEREGKHGYVVLLYGVAIGSAQVHVELKRGHESWPLRTTLALRVVASVFLQPAVAYIAPQDAISYRLLQTRAGRLQPVHLSAANTYTMRVENADIALLENDHATIVRGLMEGETTVMVMAGDEEVRRARLVVTPPRGLQVNAPLVVTPFQQFTIYATLLDGQGNRMTAGDSVMVSMKLDRSAEVLAATKNGTVVNVRALQMGRLRISAYLLSVAGRSVQPKVEGTADVNVVPPLGLQPPELLLPWLSDDVSITSELAVTGGAGGTVRWLSDADSVLSVEGAGAGRGRVTPLRAGHATVHVQDETYPVLNANASVWVIGVEHLEVVAGGGVAQVGVVHNLHLALITTHPVTAQQHHFHICECDSIGVAAVNGPDLERLRTVGDVEPAASSCCVVSVQWEEVGIAHVRASFGALWSEVTVRVVAAPRIVWPGKPAALGTASSIPLLVAGNRFVARSTNAAVFTVQRRSGHAPYKMPNVKLFTITCLQEGTAEVVVESNETEVRSSRLTVVCGAPAHITLSPPERLPTCTVKPHVQVWLCRAEGNVTELQVELMDVHGRVLLNATGLRWQAPGLQLATPSVLSQHDPQYAPVAVPLYHYQLLSESESGITGEVEVRLLSQAVRSDPLVVYVAAPLSAEHHQVSLYTEESELTEVTRVRGGSGQYVVQGGGRVVDGALLVSTHAAADLEILVSDACLPIQPLHLQVNIGRVASLQVEVPSALETDTCATAHAIPLDTRGRPMRQTPPPSWRSSQSAVLSVSGEGRVCGVTTGTGRVVATVGGASGEGRILVFEPLGVRPAEVYLAPSACLRLRTVGGPPAAVARIVYELERESQDAVIDVETWGQVCGLQQGMVRVVVQAVGLQSEEKLGSAVLAPVHVLPLSGISIVTPTHALLVGHTAPLYVAGVPRELDTRVLASLRPGLLLRWSLDDPKAAQLAAPLTQQDVNGLESGQGVSVRLTPSRAGPFTVRVSASLTQKNGKLKTWETSVEINGVEELKLDRTHGNIPYRVLLAVGSEYELTCSADTSLSVVWQEERGVVQVVGSTIRALAVGDSAVRVHLHDHHLQVEQSIIVQVEVRPVQYIMVVQRGGEMRVEAREHAGRIFTALPPHPPLTATATGPLNVSVVKKNQTVLRVERIGAEVDGSLLTVEAGWGENGVVLADHLRLNVVADQHHVSGVAGWCICADGTGWEVTEQSGPGLVEVQVTSHVTLLHLREAGSVTLHAHYPPRSMHLIIAPLHKFQLLTTEARVAIAGQPLVVPLLMQSAPPLNASRHLVCEEPARSRVPVESATHVDFTCQVSGHPDVIAKSVLLTHTGMFGCEVMARHAPPAGTSILLEARRRELVSAVRLDLLPPLTAHPAMLELDPHSMLTLRGHPSSLDELQITVSPGLNAEVVRISPEETAVRVSSRPTSVESSPGGGGWLKASVPGQELRVRVQRSTYCSSPLADFLYALHLLLLPHVPLMLLLFGSTVIYIYRATIAALFVNMVNKRLSGAQQPTTLAGHGNPLQQYTGGLSSPYASSPSSSQGSPGFSDNSMSPGSSLRHPVYGDVTLPSTYNSSPQHHINDNNSVYRGSPGNRRHQTCM